MKKLTTLLLALLFVATAANAKYTFWGYADKTAVDECYGKIGTRQGKAAIYVPEEVAQMYKGLKVNGLRFALTDPAQSVRVFVTEDLNGTYAAEKTTETANKGLNSVKFDTNGSYTITGEPFYVGYEYTGDINVVGVTDEYFPGANFTDFGEGWVDNTAQTPANANALAIQMRIEGTDIPVDAALCGIKPVITSVGDTYEVKGKLLNFSAAKVQNFRLGYTIGKGEEQFVDIEKTVSERSADEFSFLCNAPESKGKETLAVRLVSVNGAEDAYADNNTYSTSIVTANVELKKRVYMEEYTGLGCGYCVRGIVDIENLTAKYPSQFVAIAKHCYGGTPSELLCPSYEYTVGGGFPKATIDRRQTNNIDVDKDPIWVNGFIKAGTAVGIDAIATFVPGDVSKVNVVAVAKFLRDLANANYGLALAVVENDVTGYQQTNNYAGSVKAMNGWEKKGKYVDVSLQHVARLGYETNNGVSIFPQEIKAYEGFSHEVQLQLSDNVQDYHNLQLIAFIIDRNSKYVENVVEVPIKETTPEETAIRDINNSDVPAINIVNGYVDAPDFDGIVRVYTVDGKAVANTNLKAGMYIVKLVKGKQTFVKKIVL